jgi:hypothetical protein
MNIVAYTFRAMAFGRGLVMVKSIIVLTISLSS